MWSERWNGNNIGLMWTVDQWWCRFNDLQPAECRAIYTSLYTVCKKKQTMYWRNLMGQAASMKENRQTTFWFDILFQTNEALGVYRLCKDSLSMTSETCYAHCCSENTWSHYTILDSFKAPIMVSIQHYIHYNMFSNTVQMSIYDCKLGGLLHLPLTLYPFIKPLLDFCLVGINLH